MIRRAILVLVVVLLLVAALLYSQSRPKPLRVSGFVEADEIRVGSRVGGRVQKVDAIEGQAVKRGDVLIQLEPYDLLSHQAEAVARIAEAKAQQQLAQISVDRIAPAFAQSAASKEEMDTANAQLSLTKASVEAAEANAQAIATQIAELKIYAPVDGLVEAVDLQPGDLVAANAPVLSLMDTSNLWVRAYLPENRLDVQVGRKTVVRVDSFANQKFAAHLSYVSREAEFTPGNVQTPEERSKQVFRIKATLDEGLDKLRAGMAADVLLEETK